MARCAWAAAHATRHLVLRAYLLHLGRARERVRGRVKGRGRGRGRVRVRVRAAVPSGERG